MIRFSACYPKTEGATFDHEYFREKHVPLAFKGWGAIGAEFDRGRDGSYEAVVHLKFTDAEALQKAFQLPVTAEIMADMANYTTITPVAQTSEIVS